MRDKTAYRLLFVLLLCLVQTMGMMAFGQDVPRAALKRTHAVETDSVGTRLHHVTIKAADTLEHVGFLRADSMSLEDREQALEDSIALENKRKMQALTSVAFQQSDSVVTDSLPETIEVKRWIPNPTTATWLALVIPGGGQIYNRKYWKLPIFYGGFAGCAYALTWNGKMYRDYSNAYREAVNENWTSTSITDLLPPGYMERVSKTQLTETLRKRKDSFRRFRDLSIFAFIGVYLLSVVDAYVDAELSNFDITPDLSMRVEPAVIDNLPSATTGSTSFNKKSVGVQCSFRF